MAKTATATPTDGTILYLDPADIVAEDNARHSHNPAHIEWLKASILQHGVMQPGEVDGMGEDGKYRLTVGFARHAALTQLIAEGHKDLKMPVQVVDLQREDQRVKRQVTENTVRAGMSPIDQAVTIVKLEKEGVSRAEIQSMFARTGGRKGQTISPASPAWVHMTKRLLELPKPVQAKIHSGELGVAAAFELLRVPADKRQAVLDRAEADLEAQAAQEAKDNDVLVKVEAKQEALVADAEALKLAKAKLAEAEATHKETAAAHIKMQKDKTTPKEALKAAAAAVTQTKGAVLKASGEVSKLAQRVNRAKPQPKMKPAAKKSKKTKAGVGPKQVKAAAKATGAALGKSEAHVALNLSEVKQAVKDFAADKHSGVAAVGDILTRLLSGELTVKQSAHELAALVGKK